MSHFSELAMRLYPEPESLAWRGRFVHNWFSNFDACGHPVEYRGYRTGRLEFAFVAAKNPDVIVPTEDGLGTVRFIERVFACTRPGDVKRLGGPQSRGGIITPRADWDEVNLAAMDYFLRQRWQPGTKDAERLMQMPRPIVEWNNWGDTNWGANLRTCRGRNALGLLLEIIADEMAATGNIVPGAEEPDWHVRQKELIERLNAHHPETIVGRTPEADSRQLTMF